jgi:hypothetical protein
MTEKTDNIDKAMKNDLTTIKKWITAFNSGNDQFDKAFRKALEMCQTYKTSSPLHTMFMHIDPDKGGLHGRNQMVIICREFTPYTFERVDKDDIVKGWKVKFDPTKTFKTLPKANLLNWKVPKTEQVVFTSVVEQIERLVKRLSDPAKYKLSDADHLTALANLANTWEKEQEAKGVAKA